MDYFEVGVLLHCLIFVLSFTLLFFYGVRIKRVSCYFIINSCCGLYLGLIPLIYIFVFDRFVNELYWIPAHIAITDFQRDSIFSTSIICLLGYISILVGYKSGKNRSTLNGLSVNEGFRYVKKARAFCFIFGPISAVALLVYINSFGGIMETILSASLVRRHDGAVSSYTALRYVYPLVQPVAIFSFGLFLVTRKKIDLILFLLFFSFTFLFLLINAGRANIVVFLGTLLLGYLSYKNRFSLIRLLPFLVVGLLLALYGNDFFSMLAGEAYFFNTDIDKVLLLLAKEFSHVYVNLLKVHSFTLGSGTSSILYFQDIVSSLLELLPGGLEKNLFPHTVNPTKINTINFKPPEGTGIIVDLLTYGYYQLGLPGVIMCCFVYGFIFSKVDCYFMRFRTVFHCLILVWFGFFAMGVFNSLEIKSIVLSRSSYWLPVVYLLFRINWGVRSKYA
ncbi:O-antigen polymerase [Agarivorans aestuarii]|uniref:O-antigen polymerase n=1 Tax=Agarivorans aestuarii TaxID=1563703 RepID=UPI001C7EA122|nr:O-antigen polymerase [Agarivorans aestuarii]